jgi:hypothetical protein
MERAISAIEGEHALGSKGRRLQRLGVRIRTLVDRLNDEVVVDLLDGIGSHRDHGVVEFE